MAEEDKIVEVTVITDEGDRVPVGIMNAKQAASLPDEMDVNVCDPNREAVATSGTADPQKQQLERRHVVRADGREQFSRFPAPTKEGPAARVTEARIAAREVLDELVALANEAGWGTREIISAIIGAAQEVMDANERDPDPADDPITPDPLPKKTARGDESLQQRTR